MKISRNFLQAFTIIFFTFNINAYALDAPKGKVVLTIFGNVAETNSTHGAIFDLQMLENLPQNSFTTMTTWDKKPIKFSGPLLRDVLAAAKANGKNIKASALDDFQTTIPMEDTKKFNMIISIKMNDAPIPVSTKGPLFIVYPFDSNEELRNSHIYIDRSAWQLKSLKIE